MAYWNTVGSTGTVDESSQKLLVFEKDSVFLPNQGIAVIRYGIPMALSASPVDNSFKMQVRYRDLGNQGRVVASLIEFDIVTGGSTTLCVFDSNTFAPSPLFQVNLVPIPVANFAISAKCHYIEAQISLPVGPVVPAKAPAIAAIRIDKF